MTDKKIMIDNVDVRECEHVYARTSLFKEKNLVQCSAFFLENEDSCCDCADNPNCYYKQLALKAQSEKKLVEQIQTICDFINNRKEIFKGIYGGVDKIITEYAERKEQECEALQMSENEAGEIIAELKAENKELKEEIEKLKEENEYNEANAIEFKQTLIEIKEIAKTMYKNYHQEPDLVKIHAFNKILQKISECEKNNEN